MEWGGRVRMVGVWGGVAQGWVFVAGVVLGFACAGMVRGACRGGQSELGWVRIGDSLTGSCGGTKKWALRKFLVTDVIGNIK